jgi:Rrf2 family protein
LINSRFAISVHILSLLARAEGELLSSDYIAGSININPVLVRKELINLRNHNLVASREGKNGGSFLGKPAGSITISEIYKAANSSALLGQLKNRPNQQCPIGKQITKQLDQLSEGAEEAVLRHLKKVSLKNFIRSFQ